MLFYANNQRPTNRQPTEARQVEIVLAALRLAKDDSPAFITTTHLAEAVGVSQGALFKHFESKEAIWLAVLSWVSENLLRTLQEAAEQGATPTESLRRVYEAHVNFVVAHPGVPRVIFHELQQPDDSPLKKQVRSLMLAYRRLLSGLLALAVQRKELTADLDQSAAATLFMGIVQGLVMQSMLGGDMANMKTQADAIFEIYLRGMRTPS
ncbi:MAG: TetR/AcrR family transcriptional regulator [Rhodoferax sp.]|nr:TetR/AcrR family transcriptional regulator [Rhodoferax sp.]